MLGAFVWLDPHRFGACGNFLIACIACCEHLKGWTRCVDGATSASVDRPEGSLGGKLRKPTELGEFKKLRKLRES